MLRLENLDLNTQAMGNQSFFFLVGKILIYRDSTQDEVKRLWRHKTVNKESRRVLQQKKKKKKANQSKNTLHICIKKSQ